MPSYLRKSGGDVLNEVMQKILRQTPITSMSPGSIARAFAEAFSTEVGDLYEIMDYNLNQNLLSTATGSALDLIGSLYSVQRKTVSNIEAIDKQLGSFYFYLKNSVASDVTIPKGTKVYTNATGFVGQRFSYYTVEVVVIPAGRTKAYASLLPNFSDTSFTAGANTLTLHDYPSSVNAIVYCTNPKEISAQNGYETDDSYRTRIIKKIRVAASGTAEAIRFAALEISGVREATITQAPYGMGSAELVIVPEQNGDVAQIVANASAAAQARRPIGTRLFIKTPTTKSLDVSVDLIIPGATSAQLVETVIKRATVGINRYLNSLLPGKPLVYNRFISVIIDSSDVVKDVIIKSLVLNGTEIMRRNYQTSNDEQIVPGAITVKVATS